MKTKGREINNANEMKQINNLKKKVKYIIEIE